MKKNMISIKDAVSKKSSKIFASFITILIIGLLIISGPASAFSANLGTFNDSSPKQGNLVSATFDVEMDTAQRANVSSINVYVDGVNTCSFNVNGNSMLSCPKISLTPLTSSAEWDYGYGYGYGYGLNGSSSKLSYNLTLNTSEFELGEYIISITVISTNTDSMSSANKTLSISSEGNAEYVEEIDSIFLNGTINEELGASLNLTFVNGTNGSVIIESYDERPNGTNVFSLPGLGKYLKIDLVDNSSELSNETELRVYYTDAEVEAAGLNENTLKLYFWNGTEWVLPLSSGVDTANNYVWAKTNHFSSWGVFGNSATASAGGSGSCYTDWSCTAWSNCLNGVQTRKCTIPTTSCNYPAKPFESQTCGAGIDSGSDDSNGAAINGENSNPSRVSLLTGAVIGALGRPGVVFLIIIILGVLISWIYISMKKRKALKSSKKAKKK